MLWLRSASFVAFAVHLLTNLTDRSSFCVAVACVRRNDLLLVLEKDSSAGVVAAAAELCAMPCIGSHLMFHS